MILPIENQTILAHCPKCNNDRECTIHASKDKGWDWSDNYGHNVCGSVKHSLLECNGCNTIFYEEKGWDSEGIDYYTDKNNKTCIEYKFKVTTYPKPESRRRPVWLGEIAITDLLLSNILEEMYLAFDNESFILTSIGL